jgi:hypothetical protein
MSLPLKALQQALYTKFSGDTLLMDLIEGVYDVPPQVSALPYLVIGDGEQRDLAVDGTMLARCRMQIDVWTELEGRKTALLILERLYALLHLGTLTVSGFQVVVMRVDTAETRLEADDQRLHGELAVIVTLAEVV